MSYRRVVNRSWVVFAGALLWFACCDRKQQQTQHRPNIVFIMSDDHSTQAIGSYGGILDSLVVTPNIDRLRDQGALLTHVFATNSICVPSRASILTGQYSNENGVYTLRDTLDPSHMTVAKILNKHGYQTAVVGKWHLKSRPAGFDYYEVLSGQGSFHNPVLRTAQNWPEGKQYQGFSGHVIASQALQWLGRRNPDQPFMLMVNFKAVHEPFGYPQRFDTLYQNTTMPEPKSLYNFYPDRTTRTFKGQLLEVLGRRFVNRPKRYQLQSFSLKGLNKHQRRHKIYQTFIKHYLRSGAALDYNVGRVLDYLKRHHLVENTIVIYTSDQGYFLGEYGMMDKRMMYDPALRMPFIIRYPQEIQPGSTVDAMVLNIDFAPLLLDYAGIKIPDAMQGRSFRRILSTGQLPEDWRTAMYYRYWVHEQKRPAHLGIRTRRYMLMFLYGRALMGVEHGEPPTEPTWEFYDLQKDPNEIHNEYKNPQYEAIIKQLKKRLLKLKRQAGDTLIDQKYPIMQKILKNNFPEYKSDQDKSSE